MEDKPGILDWIAAIWLLSLTVATLLLFGYFVAKNPAVLFIPAFFASLLLTIWSVSRVATGSSPPSRLKRENNE